VKPTQPKDNWQKLLKEATDVLIDFFTSPEGAESPNLQRVKIATSVLSTFTRHEATESARETTAVVIAREMAENKEEFKNYLNIAMPKLQLPEAKT
jgi:hypothetical protein